MGGALPVPSGILRKKGVPTTTAAGPFLPKGSVRPAAHILTREALHMGKTLVAYFSAGGVTRAVAERLAAAAGVVMRVTRGDSVAGGSSDSAAPISLLAMSMLKQSPSIV